MSRLTIALLVCAASLALPMQLLAQQGPVVPPSTAPQAPERKMTPLPELPAGVLELLKLEGDFADAVSKGGGKAFASWFADDAVTLNNGQPPVVGLRAIAATTNWNPKDYQLSWFAEGAQMGPSGDAGFTWGHYDATTVGKEGKSVTKSGRYITFWKKVDGKWKVALDASAGEPVDASASPKPN